MFATLYLIFYYPIGVILPCVGEQLVLGSLFSLFQQVCDSDNLIYITFGLGHDGLGVGRGGLSLSQVLGSARRRLNSGITQTLAEVHRQEAQGQFAFTPG